VKNKNLIIYVAIGLVVIIAIGAFMFFGKKTAATPVSQISPEEVVSMMNPEEIGLTLTASSDSKEVIFEVSNTKGISGLDYELDYTSKGNIPRGVMGQVSVTQPGTKVSKHITLGTCSDVCHYDQDVSDIKLVLKVTKTDGTTAQVEKSLELAK
jgi:hypothetical protein